MTTSPTRTRFVPREDQYAWTFGGYDPVMRIRPGDVLELYTEDAFGGLIRSASDLPSKTIVYPFINPQTGPFYVEGAEVGDTLAIHSMSCVWAIRNASSSGRYDPATMIQSSSSSRGQRL